jgi:predicted MFS family arabinose efflux permease
MRPPRLGLEDEVLAFLGNPGWGVRSEKTQWLGSPTAFHRWRANRRCTSSSPIIRNAPAERRAEPVGGINGNTGLVCFIAFALAMLALLGLSRTPERANTRQASSAFIGPGVRVGFPLLLLLYVGYATMFPFLPLHGHAAGITTVSWFFPAYSALMIVCRLLLRRVPDRFGRRRVLTLSMALAASAYFVLALPPTPTSLCLAAVLLALGVSIFTPSLLALVVDLTPEAGRGRAIAMLLAATDIGSALGGFFAGMLVDVFGGYAVVFIFGGATASAALVLFSVTGWRRHTAA